MIGPISLFLSFISEIFLLISPQLGLLISIASKPIIDLAWDYQILFGLRPLDIVGAGLPAILILRMLLSRADRPAEMRFIGLWTLYIFANLLGFGIMLSSGEIMWTASLFFRILNGFVGFYAFQTHFNKKDSFRMLLIFYLIAGIVPMLMGLYEVASGESWRLRYGVGDQIRITGLYNNSITYRYDAYMTLTAIVLYWVYFLKRNILSKSILTAYAGICCVVLFFVFSKAAFATLGLGLAIWMVNYKKFAWLIVVFFVFILINVVSNNYVEKEIDTTFSLETEVLEGAKDTRFLFAGRLGGWESQLKDWSKLDIFYQIFGTGEGGKGGGHNDYLRSLMNSGIFGLTTYIILLLSIGFKVLTNFLRDRRSPLSVMALIIYCAWMIDTIGFTPGIYTSYQLYAWGFIGIALYGVKGLTMPADEKTSEIVTIIGSPEHRKKHIKQKIW